MKIIEQNGVFFPDDVKTDHQKFIIGSEIHKKYMKQILQTLAGFHEFAENNNIIYSLVAGSLMGYFWNKDIMPWDDDIDIMLGEKDYFLVKEKLWEAGSHMDMPKFNWGWKSKLWRKTSICGKDYVFSPNNISYKKPTKKEERHLLKIIPINNLERNCAGGLDIALCKRLKNGKYREFWIPGRTCCGPTDNFNKDLCPLVSFAGITTRAIVKSFATPYLDKVYGKNWAIPSHPRIKRFYNAEDYR